MTVEQMNSDKVNKKKEAGQMPGFLKNNLI